MTSSPLSCSSLPSPATRFLVAVKLLHTVDEKTFTGVSLRIEPSATNGRPDPDDIRTQIIAASNLLPNVTPAHPELLPRMEAAVAAIDMKALAAANQQAFDASLRNAQAILSELHAATTEAKIIEGRQLAHRRRVAVAAVRDDRCGQAYVYDSAAADERVPGLPLHAVRGAVPPPGWPTSTPSPRSGRTRAR